MIYGIFKGITYNLSSG